MSNTQLRLRRGTTAEHANFTGAQGELTVDTDKNALVLHDGATQGGIQVARDEITATGSTKARSLADRFGDVVNVLDFGADNTGATDATDAIQNALDAVNTAGGGKVFIPSGTYLVSSNSRSTQAICLFIGNNTILEGEGENSVIKLADSEDQHIISAKNLEGSPTFTADQADTSSSGITIRDLRFDGNYANQTIDAPVSCVYFNNVEQLCIESCIIDSAIKHNIELWFCTNFWIRGNKVLNPCITNVMIYKGNERGTITDNFCLNSGQSENVLGWVAGGGAIDGAGILVDNDSDNIRVSNNILYNDYSYNISVQEGADSCVVSENTCIITRRAGASNIAISEGQTGVLTDYIQILNNSILQGVNHAISVVGNSNVLVSNNSIRNCVSGIFVDNGNTQPTNRVLISNNIIDGITGASAIKVQDSDVIQIESNIINDVYAIGIEVLSGSDMSIKNNKIDNIDTQGAGSRGSIQTFVNDTFISGNAVKNTNGAAAYSILISGGATGIRCYDNDCEGVITTIASDYTRDYRRNIPSSQDVKSSTTTPVGNVLPLYVGEEFFYTTTADFFKAYGTSGNTQWKQITN